MVERQFSPAVPLTETSPPPTVEALSPLEPSPLNQNKIDASPTIPIVATVTTESTALTIEEVRTKLSVATASQTVTHEQPSPNSNSETEQIIELLKLMEQNQEQNPFLANLKTFFQENVKQEVEILIICLLVMKTLEAQYQQQGRQLKPVKCIRLIEQVCRQEYKQFPTDLANKSQIIVLATNKITSQIEAENLNKYTKPIIAKEPKEQRKGKGFFSLLKEVLLDDLSKIAHNQGLGNSNQSPLPQTA